MESQTIIRIFGYSTAGVVFVAGILVVFGFIPSYVPDNFRLIAGVVLILYGIYRGVILWVKERYAKKDENELS